MHIDTSTAVTSLIQEGAHQLAILREDASEAHIADHIRGMVAATMGHLASDVSDATLKNAEQWQGWALGVADGI
ncbi:hypothetical protein HZ993_02670 [Rhodoferax sp. AJA081-3]|uniref:hypothetical protein n=1 Tax=Rhodoferax sp. AJA081-3 TaxID=2752316 RepID=UPI001ADF90AA|nr:hypothetical protein [Rhodoferax sp. AJA081-3]QTN28772.1 hypothetical protein HZ993_02670 [Rhodoferax sp. AJA081-3]